MSSFEAQFINCKNLVVCVSIPFSKKTDIWQFFLTTTGDLWQLTQAHQ
jgi:hypothetical protein